MEKIVYSGIYGLIIGDILGVPVEFLDREVLAKNPIKDIQKSEIYDLPKGIWSDDTSMTLALLNSLSRGLDYTDIMENFRKWYDEGEFTPLGFAFGVGKTTREAIKRYKKGEKALNSGGCQEDDNGNGSLMRILPILYFLRDNYGRYFYENQEAINIIENISSLTHRHIRSKIGTVFYIIYGNFLIDYKSKEDAFLETIKIIKKIYNKETEELKIYSRLLSENFKNTKIDLIKSSGYIVDTLEASVWIVLNSINYEQGVLKAVNLGGDTDTVGAVSGGLLGIYYGVDSINKNWIENILNRKYVDSIIENFLKNSNKKDA